MFFVFGWQIWRVAEGPGLRHAVWEGFRVCTDVSKCWTSFFVSPGLCEPPFLVPVLLWVFRNIYDWLLGSDLLQPPLHLCPPHHIWRVGERRICRDPPAAARTLPEWSAVRGKCSTETCQQMQYLLKANVTPVSWAHTLWDSQDSCFRCSQPS